MSQYWWGEYTDELAEKYWIDNGEDPLYRLCFRKRIQLFPNVRNECVRGGCLK